MVGPCFRHAELNVLSSFTNHLIEEKRAGCSTFLVFLLSCSCYLPVLLTQSAFGWSPVCDCSISWSYSLSTWDVRNELLIVLYLDIHVGMIKNNIYLSRVFQGLHNGV